MQHCSSRESALLSPFRADSLLSRNGPQPLGRVPFRYNGHPLLTKVTSGSPLRSKIMDASCRAIWAIAVPPYTGAVNRSVPWHLASSLFVVFSSRPPLEHQPREQHLPAVGKPLRPRMQNAAPTLSFDIEALAGPAHRMHLSCFARVPSTQRCCVPSPKPPDPRHRLHGSR